MTVLMEDYGINYEMSNSGLSAHDLLQKRAEDELFKCLLRTWFVAVAIILAGAMIIHPYYPSESQMAYLDGGL